MANRCVSSHVQRGMNQIAMSLDVNSCTTRRAAATAREVRDAACHELGARRHRAVVARYLEQAGARLRAFHAERSRRVARRLQPGDVLLVEGNNHISGVIKYLTQSTWSHAALYVGPIGDRTTDDGEPLVLVEANIGQGVVGAPLSKYSRFHTRICRPTGLTRRRPRARLRLCRRAHRLRLRPEEHHRPAALSVSAAGAAALAAAHDVARLRPSHPHHLLGADRAGLRARALSDPAQGHAGRKRSGAPGDPGDPPFLALRAARLRHLALFRGGEADPRTRLRLPRPDWADLAACGCADIAERRPPTHSRKLLRRRPDQRSSASSVPCASLPSHARGRRCSTPPSRRCPRCSSPPFRRVLLKSIGAGAADDRASSASASSACLPGWRRAARPGPRPRSGMPTPLASLGWILSIAAALGIIIGAVFLMPAVTAFVGTFFVDEIAEEVERDALSGGTGRPRAADLPRALWRASRPRCWRSRSISCALPFLLFAGLGLVIMFLANAYLLGREYFELAAMRFHSPDEAKALRRRTRQRVRRRPADRAVRVDPDRQSGHAAVRHGADGAPAQAAVGTAAELIEPKRACDPSSEARAQRREKRRARQGDGDEWRSPPSASSCPATCTGRR